MSEDRVAWFDQQAEALCQRIGHEEPLRLLLRAGLTRGRYLFCSLSLTGISTLLYYVWEMEAPLGVAAVKSLEGFVKLGRKTVRRAELLTRRERSNASLETMLACDELGAIWYSVVAMATHTASGDRNRIRVVVAGMVPYAFWKRSKPTPTDARIAMSIGEFSSFLAQLAPLSGAIHQIERRAWRERGALD